MKRTKEYDLMVAENFLRNISLDGTHYDTALRIFEQPGLDLQFLQGKDSVAGRSAKQVTFDFEERKEDEEFIGQLVRLPPPPEINIDSSMLPLRLRDDGKLDASVCWSDEVPTICSFDKRPSPIPESVESKVFTKGPQSAKKGRKNWHFTLKDSFSEHSRLGQWGKKIGLAKFVTKSAADGPLPIHGSPVGTIDSVANASMISNTSKGELKFLWSLKRVGSARSRNERVCFVSPDTNAPLAVFSVLRYGSRALGFERIRHQSSSSSETVGVKPFELAEDEEMSYSHLLVPYRLSRLWLRHSTMSPRRVHSEEPDIHLKAVTTSISTSRASSCEPGIKHEDEEQHGLSLSYPVTSGSTSSLYDPAVFDNPEFGPGHHTTTLKFPGYMTSIIDYIDKDVMKKEINEKFRQRFPHIQLTYSKFKSVKREMRKIMVECGVDSITLAHAYVYFEKIVLKGLINKPNRKLVSGTCLLLAAKLNDVRAQQLKNVIDKIETTFRISRKELIPYELPLAVALDFNLHPPEWELYPHYQKLFWSS